ncbi:hypothetical protein RhiirC2_763231 [Rhizophagus irregularis]|uniref:Uncharacterized protein n=1 Tax=Rhizophagus irregularis TaxID=588596 RepID=A0A2N1MAQ8_9GLOM|nr:hypothetical protein RhiirC2_763231 [Rhizophagus irregularis]
MALVYEEYKANTWPDRFKHKYDLSLAESPLKEAIVAARIMEEFSDLITAIGYNNHLEEYDSTEDDE